MISKEGKDYRVICRFWVRAVGWMVESHTEMMKVDDVSINVDINASKLVGGKNSKEIT